MFSLHDAKETAFSVFYVMTEGVVWESTTFLQRKMMLLMMIDCLQVQRIICSKLYGWTDMSNDVVRNADVVWVLSDLFARFFNRYSLFIIAAFLVLVALTDTLYVGWLFKTGRIDRMWPIKTMRFLVSTLVTTLFSSVIKWLMIPIDCYVSTDKSLSEEIRGDGAPCTPFSVPEVAATAPMLGLALCYVAFALSTSFLSFETNPLARQPRASCTGRVEFQYLLTKIYASLLVFFAEFISSIAVAVLVHVGLLSVLRAHLRRLPFHNHFTNMLRGGILCALSWMSFSSLLVSVLRQLEAGQEPEAKQTLQWCLIGAVPLFFGLGIYLVWRRRWALRASLDRLRGDWENMAVNQASRTSFSRRQTPIFRSSRNLNAVSSGDFDEDDLVRGTELPGSGADGRTFRFMYASFFDPALVRKRAFKDQIQALTTARVLLYMRKEGDLDFLQYVIARGLEEHPESIELQIFQITLLRFVFQRPLEAAEKESHLNVRVAQLPIDYQYILHAVDRKATQASAAQDIGRGAVSGIHLMEFDLGMQRATKYHKECVTYIKHFWRQLKHHDMHRTVVLEKDISSVLDRIDHFESAYAAAQNEYKSLLLNFGTSVSLLHAYAHFLDTVANNQVLSAKYRQQAVSIEGGQDDGENEDLTRDLEKAFTVTTSENDTTRSKASKWLDGFSHEILSKEITQMKRLNRMVKIGLLLLVIVSTLGYAIITQVILRRQAIKNIEFIDQTGLFRAYGISSCYLLRQMMMAATKDDQEGFYGAQSVIYNLADHITDQHNINYKEGNSPSVADFFNAAEFTLQVPLVEEWRNETYVFAAYVPEYTRRMRRAAAVTMMELRNPNYRLAEISEEKRNVLFMMENTAYNFLPTLERTLLLYEDELRQFGFTTKIVVSVICSILSILMLVLSVFLLVHLPKCRNNLQYRNVALLLGMSLPSQVSQKIYEYYNQIETEMQILGDEDLAAKQIEDEPVADHVINDGCRDSDSHAANDNVARSETSEGRILIRPNLPPLIKKDKLNDFASVVAAANAGKNQATSRSMLTENNLSFHAQKVSAARNGDSAHDDRAKTALSAYIHDTVEPTPSHSYPLEKMATFDRCSSAAFENVMSWRDTSPSPVHRVNGDAVKADAQNSKPQKAYAQDSEAGSDNEGSMPEIIEIQTDSVEIWMEPAELKPPEVPPDVGSAPKRVSLSLHGQGSGSRLDVTTAWPSAEDLDFHLPPWRKRGESSMKDVRIDHMHVSRTRSPSPEGLFPMKPLPDSPGRLASPRRANIRANSLNSSKGGINLNSLPRSSRGKFTSTVNTIMSSLNKKTPNSVSRQPLRLQEVKAPTVKELEKQVIKRQVWYSRTRAFWVMQAFLLGLSIIFVVYPLQLVDSIINLGPTQNQAGRRRYLTRATVHYSRKLILDDGFTRLTKGDATQMLAFYKDKLRSADTAIRRGGTHGILVGADFWSEAHNAIMYDKGCVWKENPTHCQTGGLKPDAHQNGLLYLYSTFDDSLDYILKKYGAAGGGFESDRIQRLQSPAFTNVTLNYENLNILEGDPEVAFVQEAFNGELFNGFGAVLDVFHQETARFLSEISKEYLVLFIVYLIVMLVIFYRVMYKRVFALALREADLARRFVHRIPFHALSLEETMLVEEFFMGRDGMEH